MVLYDVISYLLSAQAFGGGTQNGTILQCSGADCPASAFTAIAAAFGTEGYYAQSYIIERILDINGFGNWAALLYTIAAIGGIVGMAMGMPFKMYAWFFIGPGIFYWLIDNPVDVKGMSWMVGSQARDMKTVWRLAEVGLINSEYVKEQQIKIYNDKAPDKPAKVAEFFILIDGAISEAVQTLVGWTGVANVGYNQAAAGATNTINTNSTFGGSGGGAIGNVNPGANWDLTSNLKWQYVDDIVNARVINGDLRELYTRFFASECGSVVEEGINKKQLIRVASSPNLDVNTDTVVSSSDKLAKALLTTGVPTPDALGRILKNPILRKEAGLEEFLAKTSAYQDVDFIGAPPPFLLLNNGSPVYPPQATCATMFGSVLLMMKWEAAQIYQQMLNQAPSGVTADQLAYHLFYGWDIKKSVVGAGTQSAPIDIDDAKRFLNDLVLTYLFKNEMQIGAINFDEKRYTSSQNAVRSTEDFARVNGGKAKFGEIYTWALMVPYFQGIMLYLLAIAYPFMCMMLVMPGMHKLFMQWIQFWAWVKLWDVGFAVVMVMERSIWAMMGNSQFKGKLNEFVISLSSPTPLNNIDYQKLFASAQNAAGVTATGVIEQIVRMPANGNNFDSVAGMTPFMQLYDKLMVLSAASNLDIANSYYIYIMAALYFAVPVAMGQLVLGSKAAFANMVASPMSEMGKELGKNAGSGALGDLQNRMQTVQNVGSQESWARAMRSESLAAGVLGAQNKKTEMGMYANAYSALSGYKEKQGQAIGNAYESWGAKVGIAEGAVDGAIAGGGAGGGKAASGAVAGVAKGINRAGAMSDFQKAKTAMLAGRAEYDAKGAKESMAGGIQDVEASRAQAHAGWKAEMAGWKFRQNYGETQGRFASAVGMLSGTFSGGNMATDLNGMGRAHQLGEGAAKESSTAGLTGTMNNLWDNITPTGGFGAGVNREFKQSFNSVGWNQSSNDNVGMPSQIVSVPDPSDKSKSIQVEQSVDPVGLTKSNSSPERRWGDPKP